MLSSAGKIPYRHMPRHHVSWHSARGGKPLLKCWLLCIVPFMSEAVLMDNVSNIITNCLSLSKARESLLKTERNPEQCILQREYITR